MQEPTSSLIGVKYIEQTANLVHSINQLLISYSDKDWNYSRIRLKVIEVAALESPYLLRCELVDGSDPRGKRDLKEVQNEITWGEHHGGELGILEIVSLRVNKALLSLSADQLAGHDALEGRFPILRVVRRQALLTARIPVALWYEVQEVSGEEFDNR